MRKMEMKAESLLVTSFLLLLCHNDYNANQFDVFKDTILLPLYDCLKMIPNCSVGKISQFNVLCTKKEV